MKVLIVEPKGSGHHIALYVRYVVRKLIEEKCALSLLTTHSAVAHPSFKLLEDYQDKIDLHYLPESQLKDGDTSWKLFAQQTKSWLVLRREFTAINARNHFDVVYVPTADWIAKALEVFGSPFGSSSFVVLYMSPKHHRKAMGLGPASRQDWLYKKMFHRLLCIPKLRSVLVIDEFFQEFCRVEYGKSAEKVQYVPDFSEINGEKSKEECREVMGVLPSVKILLVYGSLTKRKGIAQLIEALAMPNCPREITVMLAGKADTDIESLISTSTVQKMIVEGRILLRLYFHDEADEYFVFKAADYVWLGYVRGFYGSSGVLFQALQAGVPLVSMKQGLIGKMVEKYKLGVTVNPEQSDSILRGLKHIMGDQYGDEDVNHAGLEVFANNHRAESHATVVFNALREKSCL